MLRTVSVTTGPVVARNYGRPTRKREQIMSQPLKSRVFFLTLCLAFVLAILGT